MLICGRYNLKLLIQLTVLHVDLELTQTFILSFTVPDAVEAVSTTAPVTEPYSYTTLAMTTVQSTSSTPFTWAPTTTTTQNPLSPSQIMCPDGWEVFQGRCYYFVSEGMTWPQALVNTETAVPNTLFVENPRLMRLLFIIGFLIFNTNTVA